MKFSDRIGKTIPKINIQIEDIDNDLKNVLWNVFDKTIITPVNKESTSYLSSSSYYTPFFQSIWISYFKATQDTMPYSKSEAIKSVRNYFFKTEWYNVYNFIEFIAKNVWSTVREEYKEHCNVALKQELSAYRFIENELVAISDENQISQIEEAISTTSHKLLIGVNIHLKTALEKLSDKKSPDYRNSIKESISAVESLAQVISGDNKAELGKALKIIKSKIGLHGALEQGLTKIYGYTSDGDGIRHCLTEEPNLDLEDAVFMLISCSAFVNYLIIKANKAGIIRN